MLDAFVGSIGYWNALWVLCLLIFVHELGHYAVARWCGVRVETFSIGFGRELIGWTDRHGTRWKISLIPLGGYVKMYGERMAPGDDAVGDAARLSAEEMSTSFAHKSLGARAAVVAAGPAANFLFAIIVFAITFATIGRPQPQSFAEAGIGGVVADSAAAEAGFEAGDRVLSIDGALVETFEDLRDAVIASDGAMLRFEIDRAGEFLILQAQPRVFELAQDDGSSVTLYRLGVQGPAPVFVSAGPLEAASLGVTETWRLSVATLTAVGEMIIGSRGADELGGPIRIVELSNDFAQQGLLALVSFAVLLSINLGLINLFPIPMLDGGHLLFYAFEAVRGKPLGERAQEYGLRIGLALIFCLMVFVIFNDLSRFDL